jgi:hypothetical protein
MYHVAGNTQSFAQPGRDLISDGRRIALQIRAAPCGTRVHHPRFVRRASGLVGLAPALRQTLVIGHRQQAVDDLL